MDTILLNVSINETINNSWYNIGAANITFSPNTTLTLTKGVYTLTVFANLSDEVGNDSVTFSVWNKEDSYSNIYMVTLFTFLIFIALGFYMKDIVFKISSGIISIFLAFEFNSIGFPGITNAFIMTSLTVIFAGIGLYMLIKPTIDQLTEA